MSTKEELLTKLTEVLSKYDPVRFKTKEDTKQLFYYWPSLRLRRKGFLTLQKYFRSYKYDSDTITPMNKIKLYRKCRYPYYMGTKIFAVFTEEDAVGLSLIQDVNKWIEGL